MKNVAWNRTAGVELTRLIPWELETHVPAHIMEAANKIYTADNNYGKRNYIEAMYTAPAQYHYEIVYDLLVPQFERENEHLLNDFGTDVDCIEVSSAVLTSWDMLKEFYHKVDGICDDLGLIRWSEEICGTGGHVHIGVEDGYAAQKVRRLMLNHPEAMFAFCNPSDFRHGLENTGRGRSTIYTQENAPCDKSGPIAYRSYYSTVEFRMFDIAQTWEMQEEHVAFAQRFVDHALNHPADKKTLLSKNEVEARDVQDHSENFEKLIRMLKLPWRRYRDYVEFIELRHQFGTKNFHNGY
jgi:hypothetical protein